jgi:transcription antitermination factor NusG
MATANPRLQWYVVHTKPTRELMVSGLIEAQLALRVYLPEVLETRRNKKRRTPLFPRYLFVQADLAQTPSQVINAVPGVIHLVSFGGLPQPISDREIEVLRQRLDALNAEGGLPSHSFRPGDEVRLLDGPLQGLEAVFLGPMTPSQRVRVLLDFLGTEREAEVALESIERVAPPHRGRRTRGKGRRIRTQLAIDERDDGT